MFTVSYGATPQLQHNVEEKEALSSKWKLNNLPSRFRFADGANCGDFTLLRRTAKKCTKY